MTVDVLAVPEPESKLGVPDLDIGRPKIRVSIRDRRFLKGLRRLRLLRSFETQMAVQPDTEMPASFGSLLQLQYAPWGRLPSKEEWADLDRLTSALQARLSTPLRKSFARTQVSPFVAYMPLFLMAIACASLVFTVEKLAYAHNDIVQAAIKTDSSYIESTKDLEIKERELRKQQGDNSLELGDLDDGIMLIKKNHWDKYLSDKNENEIVHKLINHETLNLHALSQTGVKGFFVFTYLTWLVSMGCIGALAFVGMNAISVQDDLTFDISDLRLTLMRVVLGGLFALVLTLPFGSRGFIDFCYYIGTGVVLQDASEKNGTEELFTQVLMLTTPFLLGFSTSLVILILNQLIEAVQSFFGRKPSAANEPQSTGPQQLRHAAKTDPA